MNISEHSGRWDRLQEIPAFVWILLAGFLIKVPALFEPFVGHFASYQSGYAMLSSMMLKDFPQAIFFPKLFQLMDGQPALHLTLYPLGALLAAMAKGLFGGNLDVWGRLHAAVFSLASGWLVYKIALEKFDKTIATLSVCIFTFSPMVLITGVSFQNEAACVFFLLASYWFGRRMDAQSSFLSGFLFSVVLVLRLHFVLFLPVLIAQQWPRRKEWRLLLCYLTGLAIPSLLWFGTVWYGQTHWPAQVYTSVNGQADEVGIFYHPVLKKAQFYLRVYEIVIGPWLTPVLVGFFLLSFFSWDTARRPFFLWSICTLAILVVFPVKVFAQPFYLVGGLPAASILTACALNNALARFKKGAMVALLSAFVLIAMRYYVPPAFSSHASHVSIPTIGMQVQRLTTENDRIITWHDSQDLLYYCQRFGWVLKLEPERWGKPRKNRVLRKHYTNRMDMLEDMRAQQAAYLVADPATAQKDPEFWNYLERTYGKVDVPENSFLMYDVRKEKKA